MSAQGRAQGQVQGQAQGQAKSGGSRAFLLFAICSGLAFLIFTQARDGVPLPDLSGAIAQSSGTSMAAAGETPQILANKGLVPMPPIETFDEVVERPLFFRSRRPPDPDAAPPPEAAPTPKADFVLTGLVIVAGKERLALLQPAGSKTVERVRQGQEIEGWRVVAIHADRVVLKRGETVREIRLEDRPPPKTKARRKRPKRSGVRVPGGLQPTAPDDK